MRPRPRRHLSLLRRPGRGRRGRAAGVARRAAVVVIAGTSPEGQRDGQHRDDRTHEAAHYGAVRVVTWNVQHARRADTGEPDPLALAAECMALEADVIALQEVDRATARVRGADLLEIVSDATGLVPVDGPAVEFQGGTYGNALLVRSEPSTPIVVELPRPWRAEPRVVVSCRVDDLVLGCCHLGLGRGEAARQLGAVLNALPHGGPAVLLGDLNLGPPSVSAVLTRARRRRGRSSTCRRPIPADEPAQAIDHVLVRGVEAKAGAGLAPAGRQRPPAGRRRAAS